MGLGKFREGDIVGASAHCEEALKHDPKQPQAWTTLGSSKLARGDYEGAVADLQQAILLYGPLNPESKKAWINMASAQLRLGDYDAAVADCDNAIRLDRTFAIAWLNRGRAKTQKGDFAGAVEDCSE